MRAPAHGCRGRNPACGRRIRSAARAADRPEESVVACLRPFQETGDIRKIEIAQVERHYRWLLVPVDVDTAKVTLFVTHSIGPTFTFTHELERSAGMWSSPCRGFPQP